MKKPKPKAKSLKHKTIIHIVTGSIAAYKIGDLIKQLLEEGARVTCVMTEAAKQFITPLTLQTISGEKVHSDYFSPDTAQDILHTSLAENADLVLAAPTSANFLARLAGGFASDLASGIVLVTRRPVVIVPAMNDQMYTHPLTQQNINRLKDIGYHFIDPIVGRLACGKEAIGHIPEFTTITNTVQQLLKNR